MGVEPGKFSRRERKLPMGYNLSLYRKSMNNVPYFSSKMGFYVVVFVISFLDIWLNF